MRATVALALLGGCASPHHSHGLDAALPDVDAAEYPEPASPRPPTAIITGSTTVAWSRGQAACPLEGPADCAPADATLLVADLATGNPRTIVETRRGISTVGDENELFYVNSDTDFAYVVRVRPNDPNSYPTPFSVPHLEVVNLAVDPTYVYWFEPGVNGDPGRLQRASRAGDGSDAITISGTQGGMIFAGYFWTSGCTNSGCSVSRTPVAGGTAEEVSRAGYIIGADDSALYLVEPMDPAGSYNRIISMSADLTSQILTDYLWQPYAPVFGHFVASGNDLFWTGSTGELHTVSRTGGTPTVIPGVQTHEHFGVTSSAILYDFTATGYLSIPR